MATWVDRDPFTLSEAREHPPPHAHESEPGQVGLAEPGRAGRSPVAENRGRAGYPASKIRYSVTETTGGAGGGVPVRRAVRSWKM